MDQLLGTAASQLSKYAVVDRIVGLIDNKMELVVTFTCNQLLRLTIIIIFYFFFLLVGNIATLLLSPCPRCPAQL